MNPNDVSEAAKLDVLASGIILMCILAVAVAIEISAPLVAGVGALSAAATGIARVVYKR